MKNFLLAAFILAFISCNDIGGVYVERKAGTVLDANVIPTSFNEMIKTQIKTDSFYIVVIGTPMLRIGQPLICALDSHGNIESIQDINGNWYDIHK